MKAGMDNNCWVWMLWQNTLHISEKSLQTSCCKH